MASRSEKAKKMHEVLDQIAADQAGLGIDLSDQEAAELADRLVAEDRKEQSRRH